MFSVEASFPITCAYLVACILFLLINAYQICKLIVLTQYFIRILKTSGEIPNRKMMAYMMVFIFLIIVTIMGQYLLSAILVFYNYIDPIKALKLAVSDPFIVFHRVTYYIDTLLTLLVPMTTSIIILYFAKGQDAAANN